jgi:threonine/homoserine/homoserine lactone efflux protein
MLGVISGWTLLSVILVFGAGIIFKKFGELQIIIKILGSIYLIYLAYKISFNKTKKKNKSLKPITFLNTFFFQFVNPKSIIAGLTAVSLFVDAQNNFLQDSIIFIIVMFFIAVGSQATWCLMGAYVRKFATSDKFIKNFNYTMSFLLIVCVILFYV